MEASSDDIFPQGTECSEVDDSKYKEWVYSLIVYTAVHTSFNFYIFIVMWTKLVQSIVYKMSTCKIIQQLM